MTIRFGLTPDGAGGGGVGARTRRSKPNRVRYEQEVVEDADDDRRREEAAAGRRPCREVEADRLDDPVEVDGCGRWAGSAWWPRSGRLGARVAQVLAEQPGA